MASISSAPSLTRQRIQHSDVLDKYNFFDLTPVIGRQFNDVQLSDILTAENSDDLIRQLALVISQRNVVFFKKQNLTIEQQQELGKKLGRLSGNPPESGLHIHPSTQFKSENGDQVSVIASLTPAAKKFRFRKDSQLASREWHSDITFEPVPSDFAILKIHTLPAVGGDTVWASAYEAYDRLSPAFAKYLEGLTALHSGEGFKELARSKGEIIRDDVRGNPANVGSDLEAIHPVIRTNPVTGWKGLFVNRVFTKRIIELNHDESEATLQYLFRIVAENHDLQVRYRWDKDDIAIWSNTSSFHNITRDYDGERYGNRVVSLGEKPYFDPQSVSRRESLGLPAFAS